MSKIRRAARDLLTRDEKDPKRLFEGNALIRRLVRIGVLSEDKMKLDYVLALKPEDFLERRLQTQVFKLGLARSIHHARVLITQRHIAVGKQIVNIHHSLSDWTLKNTLTLPTTPHTVVVEPVELRERTKVKVVKKVPKKKNKCISIQKQPVIYININKTFLLISIYWFTTFQ